MMDPNTISATDRDLVVQFANHMRDIDTEVFIAKPTTQVSKSSKRKIWKRFCLNTENVVAESFQVLKQLTNSPNGELRKLAKQCIGKDSGAMKELRQLGNLIKQFETPAALGRKEWMSSQSDPLNQ